MWPWGSVLHGTSSGIWETTWNPCPFPRKYMRKWCGSMHFGHPSGLKISICSHWNQWFPSWRAPDPSKSHQKWWISAGAWGGSLWARHCFHWTLMKLGEVGPGWLRMARAIGGGISVLVFLVSLGQLQFGYAFFWGGTGIMEWSGGVEVRNHPMIGLFMFF